MKTLLITKKYLWFPMKIGGTSTNLTITQSGKTLHELDITISETDFDFYCYLEASDCIGLEIELKGRFADKWASKIKNEDTIPPVKFEGRAVKHDKRPKIHFTALFGWINDPNGLVFDGEKYHMFFQHNPYGTEWGNMTWGHAVSTDMVKWEQQGEALFPDETGTMYSGCGIRDDKNLLQKGADTLLFYYTAAGGKNNWSAGQGAKTPFTQRLAYCKGDELLLHKDLDFCIDHIAGENRDPKVFYHEKSRAYIMVLFLDGNDFAILRSQNLKDWIQTQTLTLEKAWECPDLFSLAVDGDSENIRWVFWAADGYYFIGDFDGYSFTPKSDRLNAYATRIPYAAQTYSGIEDRVISQSWLRLKNRGSTHTGAMAIPVELSLYSTPDGERLALSPIKEMDSLRKNCRHMANIKSTPAVLLTGVAVEVCIDFPQLNSGKAEVELSGQKLVLDFAEKIAKIGCHEAKFEDKVSLRIFIDYEVIEIFSSDGKMYLTTENNANSLEGYVKVSCELEILSVDIYELK